MPKAHYFVVVAERDEEGNLTFRLDDDMAVARFPDGLVWDIEREEWERPDAEDTRIMRELARLIS